MSAPDRPADETSCVLRLTTGLTLRGAVEGPGGQPLADALVRVVFVGTGAPHQFRSTASTTADGSFTLTGLPAGSHLVHVRWRGMEGEGTADAGSEGLRIRIVGTENATGAASEIRGTVLDREGRPVREATVTLHLSGGDLAASSGRTDPAGAFSLPAAAGTTCSVVARLPSGEAIYRDGVKAGAEGVSLRPGSSATGLHGRVTAGPGATAAGVPVIAFRAAPGSDANAGPDLSPEALLSVDLLAPGPAFLRMTRTDAAGEFDLDLSEETWLLFAGAPATPVPPGVVITRDPRDQAPVELTAGGGWKLRARLLGSSPPAARLEVRLPSMLPEGLPAPRIPIPLPASGLVEAPGLPRGAADLVLVGGDGIVLRTWRVEEPGPGEAPVELRLDR